MSINPSNDPTPTFEQQSLLEACDVVELPRRPNYARIQADRQQRLFETYLDIQETDAWSANSAGFLPSALVQASLPYRDPGDDLEVYLKTNGNVSLLIRQGYGVVDAQEEVNGVTVSVPKPIKFGYPYGSIPRLLLAWITTQAVTHKQREIQMGNNLTNFMNLLGFHNVSGGEHGSIKRLKDQTIRLLSCNMQLIEHQNPGETKLKNLNLSLTDFNAIYASDAPSRGRDAVFGSTITLAQPFFEKLLANPVPLDFRALRLLRQSPLCLDIYAWLTYTMFSLRRDATIRWASLYNQFGSTGSERKFRENFKSSLAEVLKVYPNARVHVGQQGLFLQPSPTHVPVKRQSFPVSG